MPARRRAAESASEPSTAATSCAAWAIRSMPQYPAPATASMMAHTAVNAAASRRPTLTFPNISDSSQHRGETAALPQPIQVQDPDEVLGHPSDGPVAVRRARALRAVLRVEVAHLADPADREPEARARRAAEDERG